MTSESSDDKTRDPRYETLLLALKAGETLEVASSRIGVTSRTLRYWRANDPELEAAVRESMIDADDQVEAVTFRNCIDADPSHNTLRMFWLKSRRKDVYGDTMKTDITSGGKAFAVQLYLPANGRDDPPAE